jgi:hypothetical protein
MVRNGNGTKWLWYEMAMVRNGYGTKWLWYEMTVYFTSYSNKCYTQVHAACWYRKKYVFKTGKKTNKKIMVRNGYGTKRIFTMVRNGRYEMVMVRNDCNSFKT